MSQNVKEAPRGPGGSGPEGAGRSRRRGHWFKVALVLSLALNLAVGGYVVGRAFHGDGRMGGHVGLQEFVRDLSPEGRAIVRDIAREQLRPLRAEKRAMQDLRIRIHDMLTAETVDIEEIDMAFAQLRRHNDIIHNATHAATIEVIRRLPAEERQKLRLSAPHPRGHDRRPPPDAP